MTASTLHLKGFAVDPDLPLGEQATSLAAEIEACAVFKAAARSDLAAGDVRAVARLIALNDHEAQLRERLAAVEHHEQEQQHRH